MQNTKNNFLKELSIFLKKAGCLDVMEEASKKKAAEKPRLAREHGEQATVKAAVERADRAQPLLPFSREFIVLCAHPWWWLDLDRTNALQRI